MLYAGGQCIRGVWLCTRHGRGDDWSSGAGWLEVLCGLHTRISAGWALPQSGYLVVPLRMISLWVTRLSEKLVPGYPSFSELGSLPASQSVVQEKTKLSGDGAPWDAPTPQCNAALWLL